VVFYSAFIWLGLFSGFRFEVGVDFDSYWRILNDIGMYGWTEHFEYGNNILANFIYLFGGGPQVYFLVMALATNVLVGAFIYEQVKFKVLIVFVFVFVGIFYFSSFNTVRQSFSVACFLYSIKYLLSKDLLRFSIVILVASLFHKSAIFLWPLYYILRINFGFKGILCLGILYCVVLIVSYELIAKTLFSTLYLNLENTSSTPASMMFFVVLSIYMLLVTREGGERLVVFRNLLAISACNVVISVALPMVSASILRMNMYFIFSFLPMLSLYLDSRYIRGTKSTHIVIIFILSFIYFFVIYHLKFDGYRMLPFNTNFELSKYVK
jgi:hypothetical protein